MKNKETCKWSIGDDGVYSTECKNYFEISEGASLEDTAFKYCIYCGKNIEEIEVKKLSRSSNLYSSSS